MAASSTGTPPIAVADHYDVSEDDIATFLVLDNDRGPVKAGKLVILQNGLSQNFDGTITVADDGKSLRFQDVNGYFNNLNDGETVTLVFTYTVQVSNGTYSTAQVTVTVHGVTDKVTPPPTGEDTSLDIVVGASGVTGMVGSLLNAGNGSFDDPISAGVGLGPVKVALGNLNADGYLDFVAANQAGNTVSVGLNDGHGAFTVSAPIAVGTGPSAVALGDINGDGKLDFVTANSGAGTVSVGLGNGSGGFAVQAVAPAVGSAPTDIALGDLNGDGKLDFVTTNGGSASISVGFGAGNGTFAVTANAGATGTGPQAVALGAFNNDTSLDVLVGGNDFLVRFFANNGAGGLAATGFYEVNGQVKDIAVGDLNGDGKLDFVTANLVISGGSFGSVSVRLGNGDGTFKEWDPFDINPSPYEHWLGAGSPTGIALGDLNKDGKLDIVVSDAASTSVHILYGNGDGTFGAAVLENVGYATQSVALGYLDPLG